MGDSDLNSIISFTRSTTTVGPGILRFITTDGDGSGTGQFSQDGLELARMTDLGFTGFGTSWSDVFQPQRTLDVINREEFPQFRITREPNTTLNLGTHADFEVSDLGNLHILPRFENAPRAMAVGFLPGTLPDPITTSSLSTALDVGGLTRIRILPDSVPRSIITGFGYNLDPQDNFLSRIDFPTGDDTECQVLNGDGDWIDVCDLAGGDLDWEFDATNVWTGHGQNGFPGGRVGIGLAGSATLAKLHVRSDILTSGFATVGIRSQVLAATTPIPAQITIGVEISATGAGSNNIGTLTNLFDGNTQRNTGHDIQINAPSQFNYGVESKVYGGTNYNYSGWFEALSAGVDYNFGAYGYACNAARNYGIFGRTCGTGNNSYAGYFMGDLAYTGSLIPPSDENLKTDIQDIEGASDLLSQLDPKVYQFDQDIPQLNLPEGPQFGLIAQEVEEVIPFLVQTITRPAEIDSLGNIIMEEYTYKGLKYLDFIALLIAGFNEQQALTGAQGALLASQEEIISANETQIDDMQAQITTQEETIAANEAQMAQMQIQIDAQASLMEAMDAKMQALDAKMGAFEQKAQNCCDQEGSGSNLGKQGLPSPVELGQNVPNPFDSSTRIDFTLPTEAEVILEISDAQGRPLRTLIDGKMGSGNHSTIFDGSGLAAGVYYYSLYANGELLTKRMLKL